MSAERSHRPQQASLSLGEVPSLISPEMVQALGESSPVVLQKWLLGPDAQELALRYIQAGIVHNVDDALTFMVSNFPEINRRPRITLRDHTSGGSRAELRKVKTVQDADPGQRSERATHTFGQFGTLSHNAVRDLYSSRLPKMSKQVRERLNQLSLFPMARQSVLFDMKAGAPHIEDLAGFPSDITLAAIESGRDELRAAIQNNDIDLYAYASSMNDQLLPIFGDHIIKLDSKRNSSLEKELASITAVNWANAVLDFYHGNPEDHQILFTEVPIRGHDVPAFRLDGLDVLSVSGLRPTKEQRKILNALAQQRFGDPGDIAQQVRKELGEDDIAFELMEYKFDVGDNSDNRAALIDEEKVLLEPMPAHVMQAQRYLALATASEYTHRPSFRPHSWPRTSPFSQGTLEYWVYTQDKPIRHDISATVAQQKEIFEDFASKAGLVRERAGDRAVTRFFVRDFTERVAHTGSREPARARVSTRRSKDTPSERLDRLIQEHRIFVDPGKVIEQVGTNGHTQYRFHLNNLFEGIQQGTIEINKRTTEGNFFARCIFPDHDDPNPSMYVDVHRMSVSCYGCGRKGPLDLTSLPDGFKLSPLAARHMARSKERPELDLEAIPDEHFMTMWYVQTILEAAFEDETAAHEYLIRRGLNPQIAANLGVGFCNASHMIAELREAGYTDQELQHYGLAYTTEYGQTRSILHNRITYPLGVEPGKLTNFYGRAIDDVKKTVKHRKLNNQYTHVPQGVFNVEALYSNNDEVIVVEGTHDALALMQMEYDSVMAIIGTRNIHAMELVAKSGKNVAIGLDKGDRERSQTADLFRYLEEAGHRGKKRDFTVDFMERYASYAKSEAKDFNEYLLTTSFRYQ